METRYTDQELQEFKKLIDHKLTIAREERNLLTASLSQVQAADTKSDLEDGSANAEQESIHQLAAWQKKFIEQLEAGIVRIGNKSYGVCRNTGKLIQKERLMAVPHTTLSMEAKLKMT